MVKPTFFQKVLGRPSQRYTPPNLITSDDHGYRRTSEEPAELLSYRAVLTGQLNCQLSDEVSPLSLSTSASLPDSMPDRKLTYTDEDWARDTTKSQNQNMQSVAALPRPFASPHPTLHRPFPLVLPPPSPPVPSKPINKAKISTARSVIGMSTLLEVEEDTDPAEPSPSHVHDTPVPQKRALSGSRSPDHRPHVSSPLRSSKLTRQRSFSSPPTPSSLPGGSNSRSIQLPPT
ncbi:hypothetical protein JVU11DRAFT_1305 [Chiua virens]|nr:hypothetical protein JVU11DRAFT_1305 [Chiua virens]